MNSLGVVVEFQTVEGAPLGGHSMVLHLDASEYPPKPTAFEVEHPSAVAGLENQLLHTKSLHAEVRITLGISLRLCDDSLSSHGGAAEPLPSRGLPGPMGYLANGVQLFVGLGPRVLLGNT